MNTSPHADMARALHSAWQRNRRGGWPARWHRLPVWPALAAQKLGLHWKVAASLFWGARMQVVTGEITSQTILSFGYAECAVTALLLDLVAPGDALIDIGTHIGYESLLMSRLTGPAGQVHSFEPNPAVAEVARRNLKSIPWNQLHVCAVTDSAGPLSFTGTQLSDSAFGHLVENDGHSIQVEGCTLDETLPQTRQPLTVIKSDTEGHEEAVLRGAQKTIEVHHPALILETGMTDGASPMTPYAVKLAELLSEHGYQPFCFEFDGSLQIAPAGTFAMGHANTLYLTRAHRRFEDYKRSVSIAFH